MGRFKLTEKDLRRKGFTQEEAIRILANMSDDVGWIEDMVNEAIEDALEEILEIGGEYHAELKQALGEE